MTIGLVAPLLRRSAAPLQAFPQAPSCGVGPSGRDRHPGPQRLWPPAGSRAVSRLPSWWQPRRALPSNGNKLSAISDWAGVFRPSAACSSIFILRRKLEETRELLARRHLAMRQGFATPLANWQVVIAGMMMVAMTTTAFYLITVYAPTLVLMPVPLDSLNLRCWSRCWWRFQLLLAAGGRALSGPLCRRRCRSP